MCKELVIGPDMQIDYHQERQCIFTVNFIQRNKILKKREINVAWFVNCVISEFIGESVLHC